MRQTDDANIPKNICFCFAPIIPRESVHHLHDNFAPGCVTSLLACKTRCGPLGARWSCYSNTEESHLLAIITEWWISHALAGADVSFCVTRALCTHGGLSRELRVVSHTQNYIYILFYPRSCFIPPGYPLARMLIWLWIDCSRTGRDRVREDHGHGRQAQDYGSGAH